MDITLVLDGLRTGTPVLITGGIGAGKTRTGARIAAELGKREIEIGGILSPRILRGGKTIGYAVQDIKTGNEHPFAGLNPPGIPVGRFFVSEEGLTFARAAIIRATQSAQVVFVDEVGRLELDGKGLADAVRKALSGGALPVLLVRAEFSERVCRTFAISRFIEIKAEKGGTCA